MKKRLSKKIFVSIACAAMTIALSVPAFADDYTYSAQKKTTSTNAYIYTNLSGTMAGPTNWLKMTVRGVYNVRGSSQMYTDSHTNEAVASKMSSIISNLPTRSDTIGSGINYYGVWCEGRYRAKQYDSWSQVGVKILDV